MQLPADMTVQMGNQRVQRRVKSDRCQLGKVVIEAEERPPAVTCLDQAVCEQQQPVTRSPAADGRREVLGDAQWGAGLDDRQWVGRLCGQQDRRWMPSRDQPQRPVRMDVDEQGRDEVLGARFSRNRPGAGTGNPLDLSVVGGALAERTQDDRGQPDRR